MQEKKVVKRQPKSLKEEYKEYVYKAVAMPLSSRPRMWRFNNRIKDFENSVMPVSV